MKNFQYYFEPSTPRYIFLRNVAGKFVVFLLICSFTIQSVSVVLAQSQEELLLESTTENTSTSPEIDNSIEFSEGTAESNSSQEEQSIDLGEGEGETNSLLSGDDVFDPPTISNPNTFSSKSSLPKVDQATGALVHRYPLDIPPGRNGLSPDLAITYNSQQLEDGIVGYGWSLSVPYIERLNKTGIERLYTDNYFTSSMGGELATSSVNGEYRHRFEDGNFVSYTYSNNSWIAYDKKGTKYTFGATSTAQLYATSSPANVFRWMLEEIRDSNNNYISYKYFRSSATNQIYLSQIVYTGSGTTDGPFTVDFSYATRTDPFVSYKSGFFVRTTDRLSQVLASVSGNWVRKYSLSYTTGQNTARSLLSSIQLTGKDVLGVETSLPATAFQYSSTTPGFEDHTNLTVFNAARTVADTDGNGLPDLNVFYNDIYEIPQDVEGSITLNQYPYFTTSEVNPPDTYSSQLITGSWGQGYDYYERGVRYVDVTGDGKGDLLRSINLDTGSKTREFYSNQYSSGFSWVAGSATSTSFPMFTYQDVHCCGGSNSDYSTGLFGNVNGDGLVDYVVSLPVIGSNQDTNGTYLHQSTSSAAWTLATSTFGPIADMPIVGSSQVANELVDINGDGLDDWMSAGSGTITFCLNTGSGWSSCTSPWNIATSSRHANGWDRGIRFLDYNGDGLVDYVRGYYMPSYSSNQVDHIEVGTFNYVYLNTGSGWATTTLQLPESIFNGSLTSSSIWGGRITYKEMVDWNGDGIPDSPSKTSTTTKPDLLSKITYPTAGFTDISYVFTAQSGLNPQLAFPLLVVASTTDSDGLGHRSTTRYSYEGGKTYLAGGVLDRRFAGFERITKMDDLGFSQTYFHQGDTASTTAGEQIDHFALLSKPFREDVLSTASTTLSKKFYRWNVEGLNATYSTTTSTNTHSLDLEAGSFQYASISDGSQSGLDITGNMTLSIWLKPESQTEEYLISKWKDGSNLSYRLMYQIDSGPRLIFSNSSNGSNVSNLIINQTLSNGTWYNITAVKSGSTAEIYVNGSSIGSGTINGSTANTDSKFSIGSAFLSNETPLGYVDGLVDDARVWARALSGTEVSNLYSDPGNFSNGSDLKGWWKFNSGYTDASGTGNTLTASNSPVFSTDIPFTGASSSTTTVAYSWFPTIQNELIQNYDGDSDHRDTATEFSYSTSTGNLLQKIERGEVVGGTDGTYSDTGSDSRFTTFTYSTTTSINLSQPTSKTVKNNASTTVQQMLYYYDGQPFGSTTKGNLTKEENWISGNIFASTTKAYNSYGLVASTTDARGYVTTNTFDSHNLYIATTTNALGHVTAYTYDYATGKPTQITDANSRSRQYTYDPVGRLKEAKIPDPSTGSLVSQSVFTYTDNVFPAKTQESKYLSSGTSTEIYSYVDGLGRPVQERIEFGSLYSVKDKVYGNNGLLYQESLPYFDSGSSWTTATASSTLLSTYSYDALRRIINIQNIEGSEVHSFDQWEESVTDRNEEVKEYANDAFGNLAEVTENYSSSGATTTYVTSYTYDALNNLTKITDALANVRNFVYDGLSRIVSSEDLHTVADTTFGSTTYAYDVKGNLTARVDPKGQTVNWTYDALDRVLTEDFTGDAGTEIQYSYDNCTDGKGRMCVATTSAVISTYSYNALGLPSTESRKIDNVSYTNAFTYDRLGNVTSITYPDNSVVSYQVDTAGLLDSVTRKPANSAGYLTALSGIEYAPTGAISYKQFGNGVSSTYTYDPNQLYRLTNITTIASSTWSAGGTLGLLGFPSYDYDPGQSMLAKAQPMNLAVSIFDEIPSVLGESTSTLDVANQDTMSTENAPEIVTISKVPDLFPGKSAKEKANIKGKEIAKIGPVAKTKRNNGSIEIVGIEAMEGGVTAYVRAWWPDGEQIGFGTDGSVDVERFRFFNPPILAVDPEGDIVHSWVDKETGEYGERKLKIDPKEALLQSLEHVLSVMKNKHGKNNIEEGKVGRTTSTFYPASGANAPVDGGVHRQNLIPGETWSTIRSGAGNTENDTIDAPGEWNMAQIFDGDSLSGWNAISRSIYGFDTSPLNNTDVITGATFSIWGTLRTDGYSGAQVVVDRNDPQNNNQLATSDFNLANWDQTEQATNRISIGSWSTSGYNDFTLNSTGISNINDTGYSWYGLRHSFDFDNSEPSHLYTNSRVIGHTADYTGTSNDPVLVVEHQASSFASSTLIQEIAYTYDDVGNITQIDDISDTLAEKTLVFTYDDLHRLTSASTTNASSTPFKEVYRYNAIGNLLYKGIGTSTSTPTGSNTHSIDIEKSSNQNLTLADASQTGLDFSTAFTLSGWFRFESIPSSGDAYTLISKGRGDDNKRGYTLRLDENSGTKLLLRLSSNGTNQEDNYQSWSPSANTWYHIAATYNGTTVKFYVNGSQVGSDHSSSMSSIYNNNRPFKIGSQEDSAGNPEGVYDGLVDDVRVWSRTLTALEIASLYSDPTSFSNGSNLQGHWHFNNNSNDSSGNSNTLTEVNSPVYSTTVAYSSSSGTQEPDSYTYNGTGYANPHAPTSVYANFATTTYTYDANGNVTRAGTWNYVWDYRNRMIAAGNGSGTTTYAYDHNNQRVRKVTASATTTYPTKYFEKTQTGSAATTTSYLWTTDTLIATVEGNGSATTTSYIHPDHLGSTNAVTNADGEVVKTLDYYPYGSERINSGITAIDRTYIGQYIDPETDLQYLNARYLNPMNAQFISQDPIHILIADRNAVNQVSGVQQVKLLMDPQQLNSYNYARNNPVINKDPKGTCLEPFSAGFCAATGVVLLFGGAAKFGTSAGYDLSVHYGPYSGVFSDAEKSRARFSTLYDGGTLLLGVYAEANKMETAGAALDTLTTGLDVGDTLFGESIYRKYNENHANEFDGIFKSADELKPTDIDKARYKIGIIGSANQSIPKNGNQLVNFSNSTISSSQSRSYNQAVASLTSIRNALSGLLKKLTTK